jgi:hypothetical protein
VPVADFFGNHPVRRDFIGSLLNDDSAKEMEQRFAPIWRRLGELLYRAPPQGRTAMTGHPFYLPARLGAGLGCSLAQRGCRCMVSECDAICRKDNASM